MMRGVMLVGVGGILTYATVGQASLHGLQALAGWSAHEADRAALAAFLLAWPVATLGLALTLRRDAAPGDVFGSAHFLPARAVRALTRNRGLIIGREARPRGRLIRYDGEAHLLTLAPTRSGKGVGAVIPNLLDADRSVLCIDPKGENARVSARQRRRFGRVHVLDPFGVSGIPTSAYNPLDRIDAASPDAAEEAATLAEALVSDPPGQVAEAHWNEEAKALLAGLILFVAAEEPPHRRTLAQVREHLTGAPDAVRALLAHMQASPAAHGLVARAANRQLGKAEREAAGVLSSAQRHTHFLDSPRIAAVTARSDLDLADLKRATTSLFLVLPPDRLDAYSRWLRLIVAQALTALARVPDKPAAPVLFLLDEFAALGRLEAVERAMGLMAGYGLQLWPILQDLHGLKSLYGARWPSFLANAGAIQVFNVNDGDTAAWVSRTLGEATEAYETASTGRSGKLGDWAGTSHTRGRAEHLTRRALLTPDEVMRLPGERMLLLTAGAAPILAAKPRYYADPEFRGRFAQTEVT